jgi:hypothetical protein
MPRILTRGSSGADDVAAARGQKRRFDGSGVSIQLRIFRVLGERLPHRDARLGVASLAVECPG